MPHLDPTYLRYIYDNLIKGSVHPDNASELPDGLIGLYEEVFEEHLPVLQRQLLLQRFALFALLKKEVSVNFVAEVLEESETNILKFINTYASWFNSPEPGKFQLYHERLKVYLFQKLTEQEFHALHEQLISKLDKAIDGQKSNEFENYALEFISTHYFINAMQGELECKNKEQAGGLKKYAYDQKFWERQIKASKGFEWSKRMLNQMMTWASKLNDDEEVIECALNKVDLYHQEQNDAPHILQLVAVCDIETALERIEMFGENDKEGLKRKFILYMLCLMELTLLESKTKAHREEGIKKLLSHFDDKMPVNFHWQSFFSEYPVFRMACEWQKLNLDYTVVHKRLGSNRVWKLAKEDILDNWIPRGKQYIEHVEIMIALAKAIGDNREKCRQLNQISLLLANSGDLNKAFLVIKESREIINTLQNVEEKPILLSELALTFVKLRENKMAFDLIKDLDYWDNINALKEISLAILLNGNDSEAIICANTIPNLKEKIITLKTLSNKLFLQGETDKAEKLLFEALSMAKEHLSGSDIKVLTSISREFFRQGNSNQASIISSDLINFLMDTMTDDRLEALAVEFAVQSNFEKTTFCLEKLSDNNKRDNALKLICKTLLNENMLSYSYSYSENITDFYDKADFIGDIAIKYAEKSKIEEVKNCIEKITEFVDKNYKLEKISKVFANQKKIKEVNMFLELIDAEHKPKAFSEVSLSFNKVGMHKEAISFCNEIYDDKLRRDTLILLASEFSKKEMWEDFVFVLTSSLKSEFTFSPSEESDLIMSFSKIFATRGTFQKSLFCVSKVSDPFQNSAAKHDVAIEMAKHGEIEEAIKVVKSISKDMFSMQDDALGRVCVQLFKQGKELEASELAKTIENERVYEWTIKEFLKHGDLAGNLEDSNNNVNSINKNLLKNIAELKSKEEKLEYIKAWLEDCSYDEIHGFVAKIIPLVESHDSLLLLLFRKFVLGSLVFELGETKIDIERFNDVLKIQWAIDLKKELDQIEN
jgi:hypothetical protein